MHYIIFVIELGCFRIVTHSCPKAINVSESIFKIKAKLCWPIFQILSTSEVICTQRLLFEHNIVQYFKTVNSMTFTKAILESSYKVIKRP